MDIKLNGNGSSVITTKEEKLTEKVLQPYYHISRRPRKEFIDTFIRAFNYWLKIPDDKLSALREILNMIADSILLIDDIIDDSPLRRGLPVAHSIYGVASTINASNYVMFMALERVRGLNHPEAVTIFTHRLLAIFCGQGIDVYYRDNVQCPSEEEYIEMSYGKTGNIVLLLIELMQLFSDNKDDFTKFADIISIFCQIQNDYCSLWDKESFECKGFAEDMTEGKFSFPILHAINSNPEDRQIINILRLRTRDIEMKRYCIELIERCGSKKYTIATLQRMEQEVRAEVARLGANPIMEAAIDFVSSYYKSGPPLGV